MDTNLVEMFRASLNWVTVILDAPSARVVLFGVRIQGYIIVEVLLGFVIVFPLSQKSYKPPQRPLTEQEIDELCDDWVPEPLIPPITEDMRHEPPVLESAAGPHTTVDGKDVVNFASANYLGLIGHEKLLALQEDSLLVVSSKKSFLDGYLLGSYSSSQRDIQILILLKHQSP